MIVLNNAEKINPVAMEDTIISCPYVKGALVVGTGRFQTALLLEVDDPPQSGQVEEKTKLLNSIWPFVDTANQHFPEYGRISREPIDFARADKPFMRASKGTIQRAPTLQAYSREINDLYHHAEYFERQSARHVLRSFEGIAETEEFLRRWRQGPRVGEVQPDQDLFNNGVDSLDVVNLTRQIRLQGRDVSTKQVYNNPTIRQLALSLQDTHHERDSETDDVKETLTTMQQLFDDLKFESTEQTDRAGDTTNTTAATSKHIILVGSTGSLGPYLLNGLLADPTVSKVTCLNRSADASSRQKSRHTTLDPVSDFDRVRFLKSSISETNLGLEDLDREELMQSVTHVIYNAWIVDFNQNVRSFKPLLQAVNNPIGFTCKCMPRQVRLFFMSSVSVADRQMIEHPGVQVQEMIINDWSLAEMGYGQSKVLAESLIADAVGRYGIDAAICRLCQLGGPVHQKGEWTRAEWIPSMILSSETMGVIPRSLGLMGMVDWMPDRHRGRHMSRIAIS